MAEGRAAGMPVEFARAVRSLGAARLRPEIRVEPMRPPRRLAPWAHAVSLEVPVDGAEAATGRLVLLHDPAGQEAWGGTVRLVCYATADLDPEMASDPLLPEVGWSWLLDALADRGARHAAAGGTVTRTASTRFGDMIGPRSTSGFELRASWTPLDPDLGPHVQAWADLICTAAGLPPPGVSVLRGTAAPASR